MSPHLRYEIIATLFITFPDKDRKISAKARVLLIRRFGKQRMKQTFYTLSFTSLTLCRFSLFLLVLGHDCHVPDR